MSKTMIKGYLFAILSAVIYGCMPLMSIHIYNEGVNPLTLVCLRNVLALPFLAILAWREQRTLAVSVKHLPMIGALSLIGCCVAPVLLLSSYQFLSSGTATVFHFIYPAVVVVAEIVLFKNKVVVSNLVAVVLCVMGVGLFYTPGEPLHVGGCALALLSGVAFAVYVVLLSRFGKRVTGFLLCFYVSAFSGVTALIACVISGNLALPISWRGWLLCMLFAVLITCGGVMLFQQSAVLIGGERTSVLCTLEPITGVVIGVLFLNETVAVQAAIGCVLVIGATLMIAVTDAKQAKKT